MNDIDIDKQLVLICFVMKTYTSLYCDNKVLKRIFSTTTQQKQIMKTEWENEEENVKREEEKKPAHLPSVFQKQCIVSCCESQLTIK